MTDLASTLRAVGEARKAARDHWAMKSRADEWFESHGEAAAAALERAQAVEEAARWHLDNPHSPNVGHARLRTALEGRST